MSNKPDSRPVFVLLTAKTCPACHAFKKRTWNSLKQELEKGGKVQIVIIEVPTTQSKPDPSKYHKDLKRFIGWFPTMSLYPADKWYDPNSELIGIVKNGKIVPPGVYDGITYTDDHVERVGNINLSQDDILKWVDYTLANDRIFQRKVGNIPTSPDGYGKSNVTDGKNPVISMDNNGRFMVPTADYYSKFRSSKVE
jgi:thiol-disulfide isomerase/thioredoxin